LALANSERFQIIRELGSGGMGIVYEAIDRERDVRLAVKSLKHMDAASAYRFKQEFRVLTELSHPNIVTMYELLSDEDQLFFTMELIEGEGLLRYLRRGVDKARLTSPRPRVHELVDMERLRSVMGQLAQALNALHNAGLVHRDFKPANVCVTNEGRAVLMDFGIAVSTNTRVRSPGQIAVGTPPFMAPEQAAGDPPTAAADWYSFGVLLYLSLTGRLPFRGSKAEILRAKAEHDPRPPSELADDIPGDLEQLCMALLARKPEQRAGADAALKAFGVQQQRATSHATYTTGQVFVGRQRELDTLRQAYAECCEYRTVSVFVQGDSGMGKSALTSHFVEELERIGGEDVDASNVSVWPHDRPIVLSGRCHEREAIAYKAFDRMMDDLSRLLTRLPREQATGLLPADVELLTRLFPVLRRIPGVRGAHTIEVHNPHEVRARAVNALHTLLANLAEVRPVVINIDDLQWADQDSLDLLVDLIQESGWSRVLFIVSIRAENMESDTNFRDTVELLLAGDGCSRLSLGPLSEPEQRDLVDLLLEGTRSAVTLDRTFLSESGGSPLFFVELMRCVDELSTEGAAPLKLDDVLSHRTASLSPEPRALLEAIATAGEPMPLWLLAETADLPADQSERAAAVLRVANLIRLVQPGTEQWLTAYHNRISETVSAALPEQRRIDLHGRIARALEGWDKASVGALAHHWSAAGDRARASTYLIYAAESALEMLAFERAADLLGRALAIEHSSENVELMMRLGKALTLAGRAYEAADIYARAAEVAPPDLALEAQRLAADNLLRSGHITRGLAGLREVMRQLGAPIPKTRRRAAFALLLQRARLRLRGLGFKPRKASEVSSSELGRLDTLYCAAASLGMIDHIQGAAVQIWHLRDALRVGEERRATRALAIECVYLTAPGHIDKAQELARDVLLRARRLEDPYLTGIAHMASAGANFFSGRARAAVHHCLEAERSFAGTSEAVEWERVTMRYFSCLSHAALGSFDDVEATTVRAIEEAQRHDDVYSRTLFGCIPQTWRLLRWGESERARKELATVLDGWPDDDYYMAHYLHLFAQLLIELYDGQGARALAMLREARPNLRSLMLLRMPWVRGEIASLEARAAIQVGDLRRAEKLARVVAKTGTTFTTGVSQLILAAARHGRGDTQHAQQTLARAVEALADIDAHHLVAACQFRLGTLLGTGEGQAMVEQAEAWMSDARIGDPEAFLRLLAPFPD